MTTDGDIVDPCFARPLPVRALVEAAAADDAVARALLARGNAVLRAAVDQAVDRGHAAGFDQGHEAGLAEGIDRGRKEGREEGESKAVGNLRDLRDQLLAALARRGLLATPAQRAQLEAERDHVVLGRWLLRAVRVSSVEALLRRR